MTLVRGQNGKFGFSHEGPLITKIFPGEPADLNGKISVGDRLYAINETVISNDNDIEMLDDCADAVDLILSKAGVW